MGAKDLPHLDTKISEQTHGHKCKVETRVETMPDRRNNVGAKNLQSLEGNSHVHVVLEPASSRLVPGIRHGKVVFAKFKVEDFDVANTAPPTIHIVVAEPIQDEGALCEFPGKVVLEADAPEAEKDEKPSVKKGGLREPRVSVDDRDGKESGPSTEADGDAEKGCGECSEEGPHATLFQVVNRGVGEPFVVGKLARENKNGRVEKDPPIVLEEGGNLLHGSVLDVRGFLHQILGHVCPVLKLNQEGKKFDGDDHLRTGEIENIRAPVSEHGVQMSNEEGRQGERDSDVHRGLSRERDNQEVNKGSCGEENPNIQSKTPQHEKKTNGDGIEVLHERGSAGQESVLELGQHHARQHANHQANPIRGET